MSTRWHLIYVMLGLMIVNLSCATVPPTPISRDNLSQLVGKWKGDFYCTTHSSEQFSELKILNENLEGEITFDTTKRKETTHAFSGQMQQGKFTISWEKDRWVKLMLYKLDNKIQLKGNFEWREHRGTLSFQKGE